MTPDDLPTRLRNARKAAGLTQTQAAATVGVRQATISDAERGTQTPSLTLLAALAAAYGLPGAEFDARLAGAAAKPKRRKVTDA